MNENKLIEAAEQYACDLREIDKKNVYDNIEVDSARVIAFKNGARWQSEQSSWIGVKERMPDDNENIIIMCEHGAIFNGTFCNGVWFCMDGYLHDTYKGNPIYSSMTGIPPLWKPVAWMPIPKFNE